MANSDWGNSELNGSRLLENAFVVIVQINMLTNTDMFIKAQAQSTCYLLQISLYIDLPTRNSTLSKTTQWPQTFIPELLRFHTEEKCLYPYNKTILDI